MLFCQTPTGEEVAAHETPASPSPIEALFICLRKYATFKGRASRAEYWWFSLDVLLIDLVGAMVAATVAGRGPMAALVSMLVGMLWLSTLLPTLAVSVRRLHDTGNSGWWALLYLLGFIGALVLMIFYMLPSERGKNRYGPPPGRSREYVPPPPNQWVPPPPSRS